MTWLFYSKSFSTAFQSYQHNGRMNTKTSVQYSSGLAWTDSCLQLDLDPRPNDLKPAEPCKCFDSNSSICSCISNKAPFHIVASIVFELLLRPDYDL